MIRKLYLLLLATGMVLAGSCSRGNQAAETWRMTELVFESSTDYSAGGGDRVVMDVRFFHEKSGETLSRPAFWDGELPIYKHGFIKADAYSHPLSAHQENAVKTSVTGAGTEVEDGWGASACWYNPRSGQYQEPVTLSTEPDGSLPLPEKPDSQDWVLVINKQLFERVRHEQH